MSPDVFDIESLPNDADNYDVFCERCQRVHRHYTFTREDLDRVTREAAQHLADAIDVDIAERIYATLAAERTEP